MPATTLELSPPPAPPTAVADASEGMPAACVPLDWTALQTSPVALRVDGAVVAVPAGAVTLAALGAAELANTDFPAL